MRQDEFIWLDLVRQFRNPDKQQILPLNFTKEIIDATSLLYKEEPVYQVVDSNGKPSAKDQKLWEKIMKQSRYLMTMDKMDRYTKLLGTVLIKVGVVDENTGHAVKKTEPGTIQLDIMHGGVYDIKYGASPYYITELLIGFGKSFNGFGGAYAGTNIRPEVVAGRSAQMADVQLTSNMKELGNVNQVYWSPTDHYIDDDSNKRLQSKNPYGLIPAVAFFNQDPAHYYFLPINEPLIYANHAMNMRITDLNHIAKFQSFGVPVVKGIERPKTVRQGRPVDDFNQLKGGAAQSRFGGVGGISGFGAGGQFRSFDGGMGLFRDGNADANALGFSIGPDTAIAVGEKGDFKFAHPNADINGLVKSIQAMGDMVRINHGLKPKYADNVPPSGFAAWMEKMGVIDENAGRRGKLMAEREAQLFQAIKRVWNTHHNKAGEQRFSEDCELEVTYTMPKFPLDPKTAIEKETMEISLLQKGDRAAYKALYPHLPDQEVNKRIKQHRKDQMEQAMHDADVEVAVAKKLAEAGIQQLQRSSQVRAGDGTLTSSQQQSTSLADTSAGEGGSPAGVQNMDNKLKDGQDKSKQYKTENQTKPNKS